MTSGNSEYSDLDPQTKSYIADLDNWGIYDYAIKDVYTIWNIMKIVRQTEKNITDTRDHQKEEIKKIFIRSKL